MRCSFIFPPELGHTLPTLPIARALLRSGHEVTYITIPELEAHFANYGIATQPYFDMIDTDSCISSPPVGTPCGWSFWYRFTEGNRIPRKRAVERRVNRHVSEHSPDLVIMDYLFVAKYNLDPANCGASRYVLISTSLFDWDELPPALHYPTFILCPQEFEIPRFRLQLPNLFWAEPSVDAIGASRGDVDLKEASHGPLIVCSFGTQTTLHRDFATRCDAIASAAVRNPGLQFLVVVGDGPGRDALKSRWSTVSNLSTLSSISQAALLRRANLLITHGGLGSIKEAIVAGIPLVVAPQLFDQPFNALRAEMHGIGAAIFPERFGPETLSGAIHSVLENAGYGKAVETMRDIFLECEKHPIVVPKIIEMFG